MFFKRLSIFTVCIVLACLSLVSCGSAKIPEIANVDEMSAKNLLSSNGLIPAIVYEYSDDVAAGYTIKTEPAIGSSVEKNSVVTIYISKGPELRVPDVANVDEETAKKVLTSNQLIPSITYEYSDTVIVGNVTRTEPEIGSVVEPNSKIVVYLSYGPSYVEASNVSVIDFGYNSNLYDTKCRVYRNGDKLYIECSEFSTSWAVKEWYDPDNCGNIHGVVALNDNFYNTVSATGKYSVQTWETFDTQEFTLEISLIELGVDKPTSLYIALNEVNNAYSEVIWGLLISW